VVTARSFALNRGIVADIMPAVAMMLCNVFHSIKAVVSQVSALQMGLQACAD